MTRRFNKKNTGETYNLIFNGTYKEYGRDMKAQRLTDKCTIKTATRVEDVQTLFHQYAIDNGIDLNDAEFFIFEDINGKENVLLSDFIASMEITSLVGVDISLYNLDVITLEKVKRLLKSNGYNFVLTVN